MKVDAILAKKGHDVVAVRAANIVADVVRVLADRRIGAVLVTDEQGGLAGIITERDIVRILAERGAAGLDAQVGEVMTRDVVTITGQDTLDHVSGKMTTGKFRHIPVLKGGRICGIISIGDVVKHRIESIEAEASAMRDYIATA